MRTRLHVLAAIAALAVTVVGLSIAEEADKPAAAGKTAGSEMTFSNADLNPADASAKAPAAEKEAKAKPAKRANVPVPDKKLYANNFYNKPAPKFAVDQFIGNAPDLKGKVVIIDFWATWCPPCRATIPDMNEIHAAFKDKGVVVVGVTNEPEAAVKRMKNPVIEYPIAIDSQGRMSEQLGIQGIPHVIVVDPEGIVRWQGLPTIPGHELTHAVVEDIVKAYGKAEG